MVAAEIEVSGDVAFEGVEVFAVEWIVAAFRRSAFKRSAFKRSAVWRSAVRRSAVRRSAIGDWRLTDKSAAAGALAGFGVSPAEAGTPSHGFGFKLHTAPSHHGSFRKSSAG
jgi:hypothetical protein